MKEYITPEYEVELFIVQSSVYTNSNLGEGDDYDEVGYANF